MASDEGWIYLGLSAHRLRGAEAARAFVVAMKWDTLEETQRWQLPCRKVYDVALAPEALVAVSKRASVVTGNEWPSAEPRGCWTQWARMQRPSRLGLQDWMRMLPAA